MRKGFVYGEEEGWLFGILCSVRRSEEGSCCSAALVEGKVGSISVFEAYDSPWRSGIMLL